MKRITDPTFKYVPSSLTDIRKTFAKARRRIEAEKAREKSNQDEAKRVVRQLKVTP